MRDDIENGSIKRRLQWYISPILLLWFSCYEKKYSEVSWKTKSNLPPPPPPKLTQRQIDTQLNFNVWLLDLDLKFKGTFKLLQIEKWKKNWNWIKMLLWKLLKISFLQKMQQLMQIFQYIAKLWNSVTLDIKVRDQSLTWNIISISFEGLDCNYSNNLKMRDFSKQMSFIFHRYTVQHTVIRFNKKGTHRLLNWEMRPRFLDDLRGKSLKTA